MISKIFLYVAIIFTVLGFLSFFVKPLYTLPEERLSLFVIMLYIAAFIIKQFGF